MTSATEPLPNGPVHQLSGGYIIGPGWTSGWVEWGSPLDLLCLHKHGMMMMIMVIYAAANGGQ